jgi:hypothetical protein
MRDRFIRKCKASKLRKFLEPQIAVREEHGMLSNYVAVMNQSPYRISSLTIKVSIFKTDGQRIPLRLTLDALDSGAWHRWENVINDCGWFGHKIRSVTLKPWSCDEIKLLESGDSNNDLVLGEPAIAQPTGGYPPTPVYDS